MIELRLLRYFVQVAETGNIGRAAEQLFLAQPSLSQQIRRLERLVGVDLFVRGRTGVQLTNAGSRLLTSAHRVIAEVERFDRAAELARIGVDEELVVGLAPFLPNAWFASATRAFAGTHPSTQVTTRNLATPEQVEELAAGRLDVGFVRMPIAHPQLATLVINDDELGLAMSTDDELATSDTVAAQQLCGRRLVTPPRSWSPEFIDETLRIIADAGGHPSSIGESDSVTTTIDLALSGLGLPIVAARWVRGIPGLAWRPFADIRLRLKWAVAWHNDQSGPMTTAFVEHVRELLDSGSTQATADN